MVERLLDAVMERRARALAAWLRDWVPADGPLLDVGSGTGHLAARLERDLGVRVVTADVSDIHVVGRPPVAIADGVLPFADGAFAAVLLVFMLAYPRDPAAVLAEAARVARGPVILVQSAHAGRVGHAWLRAREFWWTVVAFHVSRLVGYVPADARFAMRTRRFYTDASLRRALASAGLRVRDRRERRVLPGGALVVTAWNVERERRGAR